MEQSTKSNPWTEEDIKQDEREKAVDHLLKDMQRSLPTTLEPRTLSAMRNYMVSKYGQTEHYEKLVLRHESMKILVRDAKRRLADLDAHAKALPKALAEGGQAQDAVAQDYSFSQENFVRAVSQIATLRAQLVSFDIDYLTLRGQHESLQQEMQEYKRKLESRERELESKEEELKRTKHILTRASAAHDRASTTADYAINQADDLERRLQETERLYQYAKRSVEFLTSLRSHGASRSRLDAWPTRTSTGPWTCAQRECESTQYRPVKPKSSFEGFFDQLATNDNGKAGDTMEEKAQVKNGEASTPEQPVETQEVSPSVPTVPPEPAVPGSSLEREEDHARRSEALLRRLQKLVSINSVYSQRPSTNNEKVNSGLEGASSAAGRGPQVQSEPPPPTE